MPRSQRRDAVAVVVDAAIEREPQPTTQMAVASTCVYARRLLDAGRAHEALRILEGETEAGKNTAEYQFVLGRAAFRVGEHAVAHKAFSRAIELSPKDAEVYRWLARLLLRRDDPLGARRVLRRLPRYCRAPKVRLHDTDGEQDGKHP